MINIKPDFYVGFYLYFEFYLCVILGIVLLGVRGLED